MTSLQNKSAEARITSIRCDDTHLHCELEDTRIISVPLQWYPRLWHATPDERNNWEISFAGTSIHWPDVDEDLSVEGLLEGRMSGESQRSLQRWLAQREAAKKPEPA